MWEERLKKKDFPFRHIFVELNYVQTKMVKECPVIIITSVEVPSVLQSSILHPVFYSYSAFKWQIKLAISRSLAAGSTHTY